MHYWCLICRLIIKFYSLKASAFFSKRRSLIIRDRSLQQSVILDLKRSAFPYTKNCFKNEGIYIPPPSPFPNPCYWPPALALVPGPGPQFVICASRSWPPICISQPSLWLWYLTCIFRPWRRRPSLSCLSIFWYSFLESAIFELLFFYFFYWITLFLFFLT